MYYHYYLNKDTSNNPNNDHEVHTGECKKLPNASNRDYLGYFNNCEDAIKAAENKGYSEVDGCIHCCPNCHKS